MGSARLSDLERAFEALPTRAYGRSWRVVAITESTNDDARRAADEGAPHGHVVVADAQRRGRGARGAAWESPAGTDLYVSIVERAPLASREVAVLTLAVGLGVRDACARLLDQAGVGVPVEVKWPNDVWIRSRKCAGILVESSSLGDRFAPFVIGIGLDVNRTEWPAALRPVAISLAEVAGAPLDRAQALRRLLVDVEHRVEALRRDGPSATVEALRSHLAFVGRDVEVDGRRGTLEGLADDGALLLRTPTGVVALRNGTLRPIA